MDDPRLAAHRRRLDRLLEDRRHAVKDVAREKATLKDARAKAGDAQAAVALVQEVAGTVQASAHRQIASVVTRCLRAVFGEESYVFKIEFKKARGKTEAKLLFTRGGLDVDPTSGAGGGVVDVAAFALRLATLLLVRPRRRKVLFLDEPFKHVSASYRPPLRELVETLAVELGVQFVIVTHSKAFRMGKVVDLT